MQTLKRINIGVRASSCVGFILSVYAYVVETSKEHDSTYSALCDINEHMSCSRVFTSKKLIRALDESMCLQRTGQG
ncbi:Vitamin K epoxide reductase complex, subunit [Homalodisca vitripennis]|nr:Vitamin K epoxide reductase complex, subunit [Homalodisca vitripennis]KAG8295725.1 Vitamin K epoxide reductase complex, subunit [Homalodisca vitripennis]